MFGHFCRLFRKGLSRFPSVEYIVNGISGLAEGGYGPLVNTGKHDAFKSYYTRFNTFSLLPVSFFYTFKLRYLESLPPCIRN